MALSPGIQGSTARTAWNPSEWAGRLMRKTGRGAGRVVELANKLVPHAAEVGRPGCAQAARIMSGGVRGFARTRNPVRQTADETIGRPAGFGERRRLM
jgi:hypothetical protein